MWLKSKIYFWQGVNYQGEIYSGYLVTDSKVKVKSYLEKNKYIAREIVRKFAFKTLLFGGYIGAKDLSILTQQITSILNSGLSLAYAIRLAASYQSNSIFKYLLYSILNDVESGTNFSTSLRKFPEIFNVFYCNMVEIAENSGNPNLVFAKLSNYLCQTEQFKNKFYKTLFYPLLLLILTVIVILFIVILIIPQFSVLYNNLGGDLPLATKLLLNTTSYINNNFFKILIFKTILIISAVYMYKSCAWCVNLFDLILLKTPLIGGFYNKLILAKCVNILYVTYSSGESLPSCLKYAKLISRNHIYTAFVDNLIIKVNHGESFKEAISNSIFFPKTVINILGLGDETSNLNEMLKYLANFYDVDVQRTFDIISALSEPLIMVILGLIIGFLVYTIYYPIINIGTLV